MTNFLDSPPPFDFSDAAARELWGLLAANYQSKPSVRDLLALDQIDPAEIDWDQPMRWVWRDILQLTFKQAKLKPLLKLIQDGGDSSVAARIGELLELTPITAPPPSGGSPNWRGFGDPGMEKVLEAEPTFLDIAFLRRGLELSGGVCRLLVTLSGEKYYGTAFRINDDTVLTNHHVLFDHDHGNAPATEVEAWFGYERSFAGLDAVPTKLSGDPSTILGNETHDWAVVKLHGQMPATAATIKLTGAKPVKPDERVYIIQHPNGAPKKIGMIHNVVRFADDDVVQYLTDTEGGSSGSPVFNEEWELVALHHQWVEARVNGATEVRNQGRRIERVVEGLHAAGLA
ncbi:trypsin-like serine peptidase [Arthrobacter humicola]|uniref:trypsin-like serine peptidase n=1 Tax=Arthrobacter humicola TaxID=409291 RepID=UPI001FADF9FE|nr:serine protease [Arthrobacter humicola]MCI9870579.1 trypsin-like peptidase domain-containing protein [Arthrobacter humicola]